MLFPNKITILNLAKTFYTPASIIFILVFAWQNHSLLENLAEAADTSRICLAVALWCIAHLLSPLFAKTILSAVNQSIRYSKLLRIHVVRLPARYLPGGIWHTVGRVSDLHREGLSKRELTILVAAETTIPCLTTFIIGGGYLWLSDSGGVYNYLFGVFFLVSVVLISIFPKLLTKTINFNEISLLNYFKSILVTAIFWIIASFSFTLYFLSFPLSDKGILFLQIPAAYIFSWGIGFIAIFAPQGIGVFEFVAGNILNLPTNLSGTIVVLAGFRIVIFLSDLIMWLTCHFFMKTKTLAKLIKLLT